MKRVLAGLFLFPLLFCGCSSDPAPSHSTKNHVARIAVTDDPTSLDPRFVRDLPSTTIMHMLFEGLMTTSPDGALTPGIAESVSVSEDQKTYTFHLRPSVWADGMPLTSEDFVATWRSILTPSVPAPNAYQLYLIKGAKAAKEGRASVEAIGVQAPDPSTLVVELEYPASYFLEMTSCHFFHPVHPTARALVDKMPPEQTIGNGPFRLKTWTRRSELSLSKNPHYWNADDVALDGIALQVLDEHTALQLFKAQQLDWAGSPLSTLPQDAVAALKQQNTLKIMPGAGTHWFRININKPPFTNEKIRRAFALAIDRKAIVNHITQGNQQPAIGIIPPLFGTSPYRGYEDHDVATARTLFEMGLKEEALSKGALPKIQLSYASNDRNHKIAQAVQQQWNQTFGIEVLLDGNESHVHLDKMKHGQYSISMGSWYADIRDPINFLELFYAKDNPTNQTFWQSDAYRGLLDEAALESDAKKRLALLANAETVLLEAMPVLPIFYSAYNYLKNEQLEDVYFSPLGYLDFKHAQFHGK